MQNYTFLRTWRKFFSEVRDKFSEKGNSIPEVPQSPLFKAYIEQMEQPLPAASEVGVVRTVAGILSNLTISVRMTIGH